MEEESQLPDDFLEERRKLQEEDKQLASFAGIRAGAAGEQLLVGDFPLLWDDVFNVRRIHLPEDATTDQVEALGMDLLKEELSKLGMKCGGSLQERAARMLSTRGLRGAELQASLRDAPHLLAVNAKKKNRVDESARLREEKELKRQRCTQGPLMQGSERRPGQKKIPSSRQRGAGQAEQGRTTAASGPGPDF